MPFHRAAIAALVATAVLNSFGGTLFRALEAANEWQIVALRASSAALVLAGVFIAQHRRMAAALAAQVLNRHGLMGALFIASAQISFMFALGNTTVANALFVLSGIPFITAILARIVLGEQVRPVTWAAMSVALTGVIIMLGDGLATGTALGSALALVTAVCFSAYVVILRVGRASNMLPVVVVGSLISATVSIVMAGFDLDVPVRDIAIGLLWGGLITGLAHALFTFGTRHVAGAEITLIMLIEFVLGPVWVWLAFDETVSGATLGGGLLVLVAVASRGLAGIAPKRRTPLP